MGDRYVALMPLPPERVNNINKLNHAVQLHFDFIIRKRIIQETYRLTLFITKGILHYSQAHIGVCSEYTMDFSTVIASEHLTKLLPVKVVYHCIVLILVASLSNIT